MNGITDVIRVGDGIAVAIEGDVVSQAWNRSSCVAVVADIAYEWPDRDREECSDFSIEEDRQAVTWPNLNRRIDIAQLLDSNFATIYFTRWRPDRSRPVEPDDLPGCWTRGGGRVLLLEDGSARVRMTGRGISCDQTGRWNWLEDGVFALENLAEGDLPTSKVIHHVCRFDGNTMLLIAKRHAEPPTSCVPMLILWMRTKRPDAWIHLK